MEHTRTAIVEIREALGREAAVAITGPRQVGKTTLAHQIAEERDALYLDLERPSDLVKLADPEAYFGLHQDKLVILDEIHRAPKLFDTLRGVIDQGRRMGKGLGRFLLLGSASLDLLRQSETLAGRIEYIELGPFTISEIPDPTELPLLWLRGGFPRSFLAKKEHDSFRWRQNFIRTFLERDIPFFGPRIPTETIGRLWTMLAHNQGGLLNAAKLAASLGVSSPTVSSYLGLLVDLLLVRRLPPFHGNVQKRLVKSPKTYIRDSGLVHALLGLETMDDLFGHPVIGMSWEGMVIETMIASAPFGTKASFYRTSAGAEIDLVLEIGGRHGRWAVEVKRSSAPKITPGFRNAIVDIEATRAFVVHGGHDRFPMGDGIEAISLAGIVEEIRKAP